MKNLKLFPLMALLGLFVFSMSSCDIFGIGDDDDKPQAQVGDTLWIHDTPFADSMIIGPTLAIGQNGDLYYAIQGYSNRWKNARIVAVDAEDGTVKWTSAPIDHQTGIGSAIVVGDDNTVYVIGYYVLYAFNHQTGGTLWTWEVPSELPNPDNPQTNVYTKGQIGALALTEDGNLILGSIGSGVYSRGIYCIDHNGNKLWHNLKATNWGVPNGIVVGKNNTAFYYNDGPESQIQAINTETGQVKWSTQVAGGASASNKLVVQDNGNLFCAFTALGENQMQHHILNAADGSTIWSGSERAEGSFKWIGPDGTLYEGLSPNRVNPNTGLRTQIVSAEMGAITQSNRLVTAFTDADRQRKLGVFYPDGLIDYNVWMNGLLGQEIAISNKEVIFGIVNLHPVSRLPTRICAIQGASSLASSGWPRTNHDNRNTSNINKH